MARELSGRVSSFNVDGIDFAFFVNNENDAVQRQHAAGRIFDFEEIKVMSRYVAGATTMVDVGANVGNHTVYFSKRFPHLTVYPVEPSDEAIFILRKNLQLNHCSNVRTDFIGLALSDREEEAMLLRGGPNNLGASKVVPVQAVLRPNLSRIHLTTGDKICAGLDLQFLKIDVEGKELSVLAGFDGTIKRCRPVIFIEIWNDNVAAFKAWMEQNRYALQWEDHHYRRVTNFLVTPL